MSDDRLYQPLLDAGLISQEDIDRAIERKKRQKWYRLKVWGGAPEFLHVPRCSVSFKFDSLEEKRQFLRQIGYPNTDAKVVDWSKHQKEHRSKRRLVFDCDEEHECRYPVYIVSRGRHQYMMTSRMLTHVAKQKHFIVVEESEAQAYADAIHRHGLYARILVLPRQYQSEYETLDDEGLRIPVGPGAARNFCMDHAISTGYGAHWVLDDNIESLFRFHVGRIFPIAAGNPLPILEDWLDRQPNVAVVGLSSAQFVTTHGQNVGPFRESSRAYSFMLIRHNAAPRWRGRYNEDSIFSIDVLLRGYQCINVLQIGGKKAATQKLPGGNTDIFYGGVNRKGYNLFGTDKKTALLYKVYPEFIDIDIRYGRVHHIWRRDNLPRPRMLQPIDLPPREYGMFIRPQRSSDRWAYGDRLSGD